MLSSWIHFHEGCISLLVLYSLGLFIVRDAQEVRIFNYCLSEMALDVVK